MTRIVLVFLLNTLVTLSYSLGQNFTFNFNANGRRVCLIESEVDLTIPRVVVKFLDYNQNTTQTTSVFRRPLYGQGSEWTLVASNLPSGTTQWIDNDVAVGDSWEYQTRRSNTWTFNSQNYDAIGYTIGTLSKDNTGYRGQMIILASNDVVDSLSMKYLRLKKELTGEGWFVNEVIVQKASAWNSGDTVIGIRNQLISIYNNAPANDKPKALFILGHVPMPRSGSTMITAPDAHDQNKGARGFDGYYADINGIYTDTATFNPGGLQTVDAINNPGDFKWDQDFFSSEIEMAFGRVDFFDIDDYTLSEMAMMELYLDKLSNYKNVASGFEMGDKTGYSNGYQNSNDGSFRTLPSISKAENIYENTLGTSHPQWVQGNGPFKIYMQNQGIPTISEWDTYGMEATVFSSDQSYWGYNDCPQSGYVYSRVRALLGSNTKCIVSLWTTSTINTFFQACTGDPLGFAIREKMNNTLSNHKVETPESEWDTRDWWNRTHLAYNGDPTITLYQVKPPSNLTFVDVNGDATLSWSASSDTNTVGYNVYRSNSEFGIYDKLNSNLISTLSYIDLNYQTNDWYMVRAVKKMESGCGQFLHASLGTFAKGDIILSTANWSLNSEVKIHPNPSSDKISIEVSDKINSLEIVSITGQVVYNQSHLNTSNLDVDVSTLNPGVYILLLKMNDKIMKSKIVVQK